MGVFIGLEVLPISILLNNSTKSSDKNVSFTHPICPPLFEVSDMLYFTAAVLKSFTFINSFIISYLLLKVSSTDISNNNSERLY